MSTRTWQLQEAKNKLSQVIDQAAQDPQLITRRGKPVAYVVSAESWERRNRSSLRQVLQNCPHPEVFDEIERDTSPVRPVDL